MRKSIISIIKQIRFIFSNLDYAYKDIASDILVDAISNLKNGNYKKAYHAVRQLYNLSKTSEEEARELFHNLLFAEDVVTVNSVVFIHESSPYNLSLKKLASELGFTIQEHHFNKSFWTKDYIISNGEEVVVPVKDKSDDYLTEEFITEARKNTKLYYGALGMREHHQSKANIQSPRIWSKSSRSVIDTSIYLHKTIIEGGNFFCAINKHGDRYYIIGENVVSETMAYNKIDRQGALNLIGSELACKKNQLLVVPQWTYHLDLQMAYLGNGQFVIHSFNQTDIDFNLPHSEIIKVKETFAFLEKKFEEKIIDATISILVKKGFNVNKIFGCLFYLDDINDPEQQKYVPYCKSADGFDGALALMMNGITVDLGLDGRHFIVARCDLKSFRKQFEASLQKHGIIKVHDADMLDSYDYTGSFDGLAAGIWGANSVTQVAAFMNGALRCQTSIVSKALCKTDKMDYSSHQFFDKVQTKESSQLLECEEEQVELEPGDSQELEPTSLYGLYG